jgi:hypothetical protein
MRESARVIALEVRSDRGAGRLGGHPAGALVARLAQSGVRAGLDAEFVSIRVLHDG